MKKNSSVISLSFIVLLLLVSCVSSSSNLVKHSDDIDWVKNYTDTNGDVIFYKIEHRIKDVVQVWGKRVFSDKGRKEFIQDRIDNGLSVVGMDKLEYFTYLNEINCNANTGRVLSVVYYNTDGKVVYSSSFGEPKLEDIVPNSIGDSFRKKVCK
jgi:hypothetical protein